LGSKDVAFSFQESTQFLIVVDLPVENDPNTAILVRERLVAGVQVDDRESPMTQTHLGPIVGALIIRTSMTDRIQHFPNQSRADTIVPLEIKLSANSTHTKSLEAPSGE
jgi:hypothetical protein